MRDCTKQIPVELLSMVFNQLSTPELFVAAAVCARWRALAKLHDNCYALASIDMSDWWDASKRRVQEMQQRFMRTIDTARDTDTRLRITMNIHEPWGAWDANLSCAQDAIDATGDAIHLLQHLSVELPSMFASVFFDAVCEKPAPVLQHFRFYLYGRNECIPHDLLLKAAPRLTSVSLEGTVKALAPVAPIAAFARAQVVALNLEDSEKRVSFVDTMRAFPNVQHLTCHFNAPLRKKLGRDDVRAVSRLRSLSLILEAPRGIKV